MVQKTPLKTLSIAQWVTNLSHPVDSLEAWCGLVESLLVKAKGKGCDILMLPEYISEHWMSFSPALKPTEELAWCATQAVWAIPRLQKAVRKTGVALLAGTMPWRAGKGDIVNRAWMLFPDRTPVHHDKLVLIPSEKSKGGWMVKAGQNVRVFKWRGVSMTILICLDIEMPALSHKLAEADVDLVLVPSMTEKRAGYHRVFSCARARAVELMAAIAVTGCIGGSLKNGQRRTTCNAGAAVYLPSEEIFGHTGILDEIPPHATAPGIGKVLYAKNIPVGKIRATRHGKPEVWPGAWTAKGVKISQA